MIDITATLSQSAPFQWGPILGIVLVAMIGAAGWAVRRILARIDDIGKTLNGAMTDIAVLKERQKLTATKVGVKASELEDRQ